MNSESLIAQIENIVLPQSERPSMPKVDRMFSYLVLAIAALALVSSNLEPGYRVGDNSKDAAGMCAQGGEASFRLLLTHPLNEHAFHYCWCSVLYYDPVGDAGRDAD
jgi:hypothetical protein